MFHVKHSGPEADTLGREMDFFEAAAWCGAVTAGVIFGLVCLAPVALMLLVILTGASP